MTNERQRFSLFGRTPGRRFGNFVGLALLLGYAASKYFGLDIGGIYVVEIPVDNRAFRSNEELRSAINSFRPTDGKLQRAADAMHSTIPELKKAIFLRFSFEKPSTTTLRMKCSPRRWTKIEVAPVCDVIGAELKDYLAQLKSPKS